jgi:demethylmenaquinone methyltransferase/2-methoxy-6-polyprenyl-1,4-benzoquinol methylase
MTAEPASADYYTPDKAEYVRRMFAGIADRYDLLNDILSFRRHHAWRRRAVALAHLHPGDSALDVCAGTGDFAIALGQAVGPTGMVVGADFCAPMLRRGRRKTDRTSGGRIRLMVADALRLPYRSNRFDAVTVGFGIRNVADVAQALAEMVRVTRPGGRVVCLEFCEPRNGLLRSLVRCYEGVVLPRIGSLLSRREAYTYLPASIRAFHSREALADLMRAAGLTDVQVCEQNLGSVCIHTGTKR